MTVPRFPVDQLRQMKISTTLPTNKQLIDLLIAADGDPLADPNATIVTLLAAHLELVRAFSSLLSN
jgi:hypothetical protein